MAVGTVRSAFEYGGQKCSACSRMYIPQSMWPEVKQKMLDILKEIQLGSPLDNKIFLSAVIDDKVCATSLLELSLCVFCCIQKLMVKIVPFLYVYHFLFNNIKVVIRDIILKLICYFITFCFISFRKNKQIIFSERYEIYNISE